MTIYKLFDKNGKCYITDEAGIEFTTDSYDTAEDTRWDILEEWGYPLFTFPTAIEIHVFENGIFKGVSMLYHTN